MSLLVKTKLGHSNISGIGCFADEFIPKGTKIWEYNSMIDRCYVDSDIRLMSDLEREFIHTYAYRHNGMLFLCVDNSRFFNHSDSPNTADPEGFATYASRDIEVGEEIVSDYYQMGTSDEDSKFNIFPLTAKDK